MPQTTNGTPLWPATEFFSVVGTLQLELRSAASTLEWVKSAAAEPTATTSRGFTPPIFSTSAEPRRVIVRQVQGHLCRHRRRAGVDVGQQLGQVEIAFLKRLPHAQFYGLLDMFTVGVGGQEDHRKLLPPQVTADHFE